MYLQYCRIVILLVLIYFLLVITRSFASSSSFDLNDPYYWNAATGSFASADNWQYQGAISDRPPGSDATAIVLFGSATLEKDSTAKQLVIGGSAESATVYASASETYLFSSIDEIRIGLNGSLILNTGNRDVNFSLGADLYLEGGTICATGTNQTLRLVGANNVMESGTITLRRFAVGYPGETEPVNFTMNGGTITTLWFPIGYNDHGIFTLNDGLVNIGKGTLASDTCWEIGNGNNAPVSSRGEVFINGGTVDISNGTVHGALKIGVGTNLGQLTQTGGIINAASVVMGANSDNFYKISGGNLNVSASVAIPTASMIQMSGGTITTGRLTISDKSELNLGGGNITITGTTAPNFDITNSNSTAASTLTLNAGTFSNVLSGNLNLTKTGKGNLTLNRGNAYTGATTVSSGSLILTETNAIAASQTVVNNAAISFSADQTFQNLSGTGTIAPLVSGASNASTNRYQLTLKNTVDSTYHGTVNAGWGTIYKTGVGTLKLTSRDPSALTAETIALSQGRIVLDSGDSAASFDVNELLFHVVSQSGEIETGQLSVVGQVVFGSGSLLELAGTVPETPTISDSYDLITTTDGIVGADAFDWKKILADSGFNTAHWSLALTNNSTTITLSSSAQPVKEIPEPTTWTLLALGTLLLAFLRRRNW